MRVRVGVLFVLAVQLVSSCLAKSNASPLKPKKAVTPASSYVPDVTLHLTNRYCDTALPYVYTDKQTGASLQLVKHEQALGPVAKQSKAIYEEIDKLSGSNIYIGLPSDFAKKVDEAVDWSKMPLKITDPGGSILGDSDRELSPDGSDAARLLVRTLQPSLAANACDPNALAPPNTAISEQLGTGFFSFSVAAYYLIDIVRWKATAENGKDAYEVASDHWYLFDYSDPRASHRKAPFTFHPFVTADLRIFGNAAHPERTNVVFLAIHLAPQGDRQKWFNNVDISYKLHADKLVPANVQDLESLINFLVGGTLAGAPEAKANPPLPFQGRYAASLVANLRDLPAQLTSTMTASFSGVPDKSEPAYSECVDKNLLNSAGKPAATCQSSPQTSSTNFNDSGRIDSIEDSRLKTGNAAARPRFLLHPASLLRTDYKASWFFPAPEELVDHGQQSDTTTNPPATNAGSGNNARGGDPANGTKQSSSTGANCDSSTTTDPATKEKTQKPCTLTQKITDEGLYHWDVSIAVPITGYKETVFDSNNALTPKSVTRTNAYAMLDIAPWGEDFVKPQLFGIPHLMTGLPLSGKVFNKPFVGGLGEEVGLTKLLPFSARIFGGVVYNKEFRGANQNPHRVWKVQYGIELSMSSAISKLKSKTTSKTNSKTAGN
jgi:hypothetical protein